MIIELPVTSQGVSGKVYRMGFYHFSNNNLAVRKRCAEELGMYDPAALTSEDVDLCFRAALHPHWVCGREPGMVVRHKARGTVAGMLRQMWGWGVRLAGPYAKTGIRGAYLYWVSSSRREITGDLELPRLPLLACLFLGDFHAAHLLAAAAAVLAALGYLAAGAVAAAAAAALLWRSLAPVREARRGPWTTLKVAALLYAANVTFLTAAFLGGLRRGVILLPCSILPPRGAAER